MRCFKAIRREWTLFAAILSVTPLAGAQVRSDPPRIVTRYCSGCHGLNGNSQLPYIPRLAGMEAAYLVARFATYRAAAAPPVDEMLSSIVRSGPAKRHSGRTTAAEAEMVGVARLTSDDDAKAAADWYASQKPVLGKGGNRKANGDGERLYTSGLESRGLQACQSCHGPAALGHDTAPRLAGQNAGYVLGQLALFRSGERRSSPMMDVARYLGDDEAHALAAYLQTR
jgi:cytochrome c553